MQRACRQTNSLGVTAVILTVAAILAWLAMHGGRWASAQGVAAGPAPAAQAASPASSSASAATSKPARWRDRWGKGEILQRIRPAYNDEYLNNPHKGTTTFQRFNGDPLYPTLRWDDSKGPLEFLAPKNADLSNDHYPPTRMSYCRWVWRVIEPEKGKIRFDLLDAALKTAADRGQTLQMRMQPWVGREDAPDWYYQAGGTHIGRTPEMDHNNPAYLKHWGEFIRALSQRYDGNPTLESFDVAYGGQFGEEGGNASPETAAKLVDIYCQAFPKTQLLLMLGTPGCKYAGTMLLATRTLGWRADCYGDVRDRGRFRRGPGSRPASGPGSGPSSFPASFPASFAFSRPAGPASGPPEGLSWNHMRDAYPQQVAECGLKDAWKTAPVTLETGGTVGSWRRGNLDLDWIIEQGYKYHVSVFMPKSVAFPDEWMPKLMEFNKRIGYRFFLHQMNLPLEAKAGQTVEMFATIDNKGCAPIYRPYHFALRFTQGDRHWVIKLKQDIRTWLPDLTFFREKFVFPADLKLGEVKVACSIVNDLDQPVVKLAIKPLDADGWHPLTSMDVVEKESRPIDSWRPSDDE